MALPSKYSLAYPKQGQPLSSMRNPRGASSLETIPSDRQLHMCASQPLLFNIPAYAPQYAVPMLLDLRQGDVMPSVLLRKLHFTLLLLHREDLAIRSNSEPDKSTSSAEEQPVKAQDR